MSQSFLMTILSQLLLFVANGGMSIAYFFGRKDSKVTHCFHYRSNRKATWSTSLITEERESDLMLEFTIRNVQKQNRKQYKKNYNVIPFSIPSTNSRCPLPLFTRPFQIPKCLDQKKNVNRRSNTPRRFSSEHMENNLQKSSFRFSKFGTFYRYHLLTIYIYFKIIIIFTGFVT
jgi:hypothetical protein